jgi:hypothetical protein
MKQDFDGRQNFSLDFVYYSVIVLLIPVPRLGSADRREIALPLRLTKMHSISKTLLKIQAGRNDLRGPFWSHARSQRVDFEIGWQVVPLVGEHAKRC